MGVDAPNDTTQARLRVSQCVYVVPDMDVYLNGTVPVVADAPLSHLGAGNASRYEYLEPGTYPLAVVPTGQDLSKALLGPLDVPVAAGHRYTVVVLGQKDDASHQALVIDETAAYQAIGAQPTDAAHISVNNIKGVPGIDVSVSGVVRDANVPYGGFKAAVWPAGPFNGLAIGVHGGPADALGGFDGVGYDTPGLDFLDCFGGSYPGTPGVDNNSNSSASTSSLNILDFLQINTDVALRNGGQAASYSTFLAAVKTAGLSDMLVHGGPYLLLVPTDEAFAALPKDQLAALLADPKALADLLRSHVVAGYYPPGVLGQGGFDRTVTNLLGAKLGLTGGGQLIVNGDAVAGGGDYAMVANGTRLFWINKLLAAPAAAPTAPPALLTPATPAATAVPPAAIPTTGAGANLAELFAVLGVGLALLLAGGLLRRRPARRR
jgi:uncharacterized surface protein with fasciclin (FAS1) repeats